MIDDQRAVFSARVQPKTAAALGVLEDIGSFPLEGALRWGWVQFYRHEKDLVEHELKVEGRLSA